MSLASRLETSVHVEYRDTHSERVLPNLTTDGLLPSIVDNPRRRSPFPAHLNEVERMFGYSAERRRRMENIRRFRRDLAGLPLKVAFQWLSGSLLETSPDDGIDIAIHSFYTPPRDLIGRHSIETFQKQHASLFDPACALAEYGLVPHFLPLNAHPAMLSTVAAFALTEASYSARTGKMRGVVALLRLDD